MPNLPRPYVMRDWKQVARDYDATIFNTSPTRPRYLWWNQRHLLNPADGFGLPAYVCTEGDEIVMGESIHCAAAVLSASLVGIDKSRQDGRNYVKMLEACFDPRQGANIFQNDAIGRNDESFWYSLYTHILICQVSSLYPRLGRLDHYFGLSADQWARAVKLTDGRFYDMTTFDFVHMRPVDTGRWREPDAPAGIAWLEYMAWRRTGDARYLEAADLAMKNLAQLPTNPFYEILLPYGAYLAARMNAELGRAYEVQKYLDWSFGPSEAPPQRGRRGWGVVAENWGGQDCYGLVGSLTDGGGYAFAMNTFDLPATLLPIVRYDARYARTLGKWVLNLANAARLFYHGSLDAEHQMSKAVAERIDPKSCIAYEGLRKSGSLLISSDKHEFKTLAGRDVTRQYVAAAVKKLDPMNPMDLREVIFLRNPRFEVLEAAQARGAYGLERVWSLPLAKAHAQRLFVQAQAEPGGPSPAGFVFSYATRPEGPYTDMFTVANPKLGDHDFPLDDSVSGTIYVRARTADRAGAKVPPDRLCVRSIFVRATSDASPFATGDDMERGGYGLGLYGSSHVGSLAAVVERTGVDGILQLDCLKTDFFHEHAYPTYLYYNPYDAERTVALELGDSPKDLYNPITHELIGQNVKRRTGLRIAADSALLVVVAPAGAVRKQDGRRVLLDGVVVDYAGN
jgi:hypothetical protein